MCACPADSSSARKKTTSDRIPCCLAATIALESPRLDPLPVMRVRVGGANRTLRKCRDWHHRLPATNVLGRYHLGCRAGTLHFCGCPVRFDRGLHPPRLYSSSPWVAFQHVFVCGGCMRGCSSRGHLAAQSDDDGRERRPIANHWLAMPRPQFSIRTLLVAMLIAAAFFGGIDFERERRRRDDEAAALAAKRVQGAPQGSAARRIKKDPSSLATTRRVSGGTFSNNWTWAKNLRPPRRRARERNIEPLPRIAPVQA